MWKTRHIKWEENKCYGVKQNMTYNQEKQTVSIFNPLQPSVAFLYPLKTSENLSGGIEKQHWTVMG